jgi:hypothetical protein
MLVDSPHQALQIRCESAEHLLSLFIGELVGIRSKPRQQGNGLRAGSLDAAVPRRAALLRGACRH